jgi:DNA-binding CsgD family transcriptional regulator
MRKQCFQQFYSREAILSKAILSIFWVDKWPNHWWTNTFFSGSGHFDAVFEPIFSIMSTFLKPPALTGTCPGRAIKAKGFLFAFLLISCVATFAQTDTAAATYNIKVADAFYLDCKNALPDNVHRICLDFLRKYKLRKTPRVFEFCGYFKTKSLEEGNKALNKRMRLIELTERLRYQKTSPEEAEKSFESLYNEFANAGDYSAALECLFELAQFHKSNINALKVLFFAEKLARQHNLQNDISFQAVLHKIGYLLWDLDKPVPSIDYFKKSLATGRGLPIDSLIALNGIGINYQRLDSLQRSMDYFEQASRYSMAVKNDVFNKVVLGSAAVTLYKLGQPGKAYDYAMQCKDMSFKELLWNNATGALHLLIQIELNRNNLAHCKILLDSLNMIRPGLKADDFTSLKRQHEANYLYFEKLQNYRQALVSYKAFVHYDSLFQDYANKNKIAALAVDAEVRLYEQEMARKEKARRLKHLAQVAATAALAAGVLLLMGYLYKKVRKTEKEKRAMASINTDQAEEIGRLKVKLLAQLEMIKASNQQYQALLAANGSGNIEATEEIAFADADAPADKDGDVAYLKAFNLTQKDQWKTFKESFIEMYPDFEKNIIRKTGAVSAAELRLMMLHKLGLGNKEIAQTLLISVDGVKKGKYRLYKKLGITSAEELSELL